MFCGRDGVVSFGPPQAENFWENPGFFTQSAAGENILVFGGLKWCHITIFDFWAVKMLPYIHIFHTSRRRRENLGFFGVKMVPYIHIFDFFWGQNAAIYTHLGFFLGSKCYHMYTFWGFFGWKCCHIYTFLEFNFSRKNEKKKKNNKMCNFPLQISILSFF